MFENLLFELRAAERSCSCLAGSVRLGLIVLLLAMVASIGAVSAVPKELAPLMASIEARPSSLGVADSGNVFNVMLK